MLRPRFMSVAVVSVALILPAAMLTTSASSQAQQRAGSCAAPAPLAGPKRIGHVAIAAARREDNGCGVSATKLNPSELPYLQNSTPPLLNHGGRVMATSSTASLVITPIFWQPSGYTFANSYKSLIETYLGDVAHDSGKKSNVFSTLTQYSGSNGTIHYKVAAGTPITDTSALPALACTVNTGAIYSDNTGYNACVDDAQARAEVGSVVAGHSLPSDLNHVYALFLPKAVESCFYADAAIPIGHVNSCTINSSPTAAYCAYHSAFGATGNEIYAMMAFPAYQSATGFTCSSDRGSSAPQTPNNNVDGDTVISTLSHEVSESISDPRGDAWWASDGNENGDLCAYIYGDVLGTTGHKFNQTINAHHYLTQEEFSNEGYVQNVAGCEQTELAPAVASLSRTSGSHSGGGTPITIHGTTFRPGKTTVKFGTTKGTSVHVTSPTTLTVVAPAHPAGLVNVRVSTPNGTSPITTHDRYTYH